MKTLLSTACTCLAQLLAQPASALTYDVHTCTPGVNCNVGSHGTSGSSGPTNTDFQDFFATQLGFDTSTDAFTWGTNTNANGYWFGVVDDTNLGIHTSYLWNGTQLLCCTLDEPYAIVDGNDHNLFVGNYGFTLGQQVYPGFLGAVGGPMGLPPVPYNLTPQGFALIGGLGFTINFVAIDNNDRILANWDGPSGWLEFDPATSVPEPATALLLLPLFAGVFGFRRRWPA